MHHLALLSTPPKPTRFEYSERLTERKRALFPTQNQDSDDSDIGHMSPLEYSSSPESIHIQNSPESRNRRYFGFDQTNIQLSPGFKRIEDSEESNDAQFISGKFSPNLYRFNEDSNQENIDPKQLKSVTFESTNTAILVTNSPESTSSSVGIRDDTSIPKTPAMSPTEILKTPHDSSNNNTNVKLPRLVRKSLLDITNFDATSLKRKSESPIDSSSENKTLKFDHTSKTSKARTALFPESLFPAKSFYPKTETESKYEVPVRVDQTQNTKKVLKKNPLVYLCNRGRGRNKNKYFGQINAGVRHGIKKPRLKPALTKSQLLKAALNIVKNSPLNEYFDTCEQQSISSENECGVSFEQIQKMDSILKNLDVRTINAEPLKVFQDRKPVSSEIPKHHQTFGVKRSLSPQPDHTKKFFKSGHSKATFTISNNMKLQLEHGEFSLIEKQQRVRRPQREIIEYDPTDFSFTEDTTKITDNSFNDILKSLEDDHVLSPPSIQTLTAHNSVLQSDSSIHLHNLVPNPVANLTKRNNSMLLSPTSLVCDLTSGLVLDSPKNQPVPATNTIVPFDKLSTLKKRICFPETMDNQQKLFPIFHGKQNDVKPVAKENKHVKNIRKIWKPLSEDQTIIDAGQKKYGLTQCAECKCVYSLGEPEDEIMHHQHHNSVSVLRYNNWKHERIVNHFSNGKVIQINPNDPKSWWKKVKELMEVINRELGFVDIPFDAFNKKVFLCIINKQIVGCLVAEPKSHAHKMLPDLKNIDQCTEETFPVKCGISRLWVAVTHRKMGVATCLMNAMRSNFMYGHILSMQEIAFSAPTDAGKKFASKYTKTEEFLIYTS